MIHTIQFPGLGELEAIPNGDAAFYTELLGVAPASGRPGAIPCAGPAGARSGRTHRSAWACSPTNRVKGFDCAVTPHQFMVKLLEPQLQYTADEKDLVAMVNIFSGLEKRPPPRPSRRHCCIERDLKSGLYGMSLGVGYPASIVAQMIAAGEITTKGVLNPALHVPYAPFMAALAQRGIVVTEEVE